MSGQGAALDRLAELEEERDFLLRSLDDLDREHEAGDVDETDYRTLRDGYTARAATVIREVEAGRVALVPRSPVRWARLAAITLSVVAVGVLAGWLVAHYSGQDVPPAESSLDTDDQVAVLLAQARQLSPLDALPVYGDVLQLDPGNVEALTYSGWSARIVALQVPAGAAHDQLVDAAADKLRQAIAVDVTYPDAQCFLAVLLFRDLGDAAGAKPYLDGCIAANPPAVVRDLVTSLESEINAAR